MALLLAPKVVRNSLKQTTVALVSPVVNCACIEASILPASGTPMEAAWAFAWRMMRSLRPQPLHSSL